MTTYILANFKANLTRQDAIDWLESFLNLYTAKPNLEIILAPPSVFLDPLRQILDHRQIPQVSLAVQDLSPFPRGSYTGAIAADMLKSLVDFAIVGHSERRHHFRETHTEIARKVYEAQTVDITPILCLDLPYARQQLAALDQHLLENKLLIGYGPVESVNLEIPQDPDDQQNNILAIQKRVPNLPILYGGSVRPDNAKSYLNLKNISGLMVGSSCLDPKEFAQICTNCIPNKKRI